MGDGMVGASLSVLYLAWTLAFDTLIMPSTVNLSISVIHAVSFQPLLLVILSRMIIHSSHITSVLLCMTLDLNIMTCSFIDRL